MLSLDKPTRKELLSTWETTLQLHVSHAMNHRSFPWTLDKTKKTWWRNALWIKRTKSSGKPLVSVWYRKYANQVTLIALFLEVLVSAQLWYPGTWTQFPGHTLPLLQALSGILLISWNMTSLSPGLMDANHWRNRTSELQTFFHSIIHLSLDQPINALHFHHATEQIDDDA